MIPARQLGHALTSILEIGFPRTRVPWPAQKKVTEHEHPAYRKLENGLLSEPSMMPGKNTTHLPVRIGVSSCLLGEEVRFDGGHKRDSFLLQTLGSTVEWVSVCPEVEVGLGAPREAIQLIRDRGNPNVVRLVTRQTGVDLTRRMREYARRRVRELTNERLSGYILKKDSPTCGMEQVKVWHHRGTNERNGRGIFAAELLRQFPTMPVEDEGRLHDPKLLEAFIDRVFMYHRLRNYD
ncbi:MAG TPA: DUF523 domain-containing protein [Vicinamibacterales bacterium]|nr:DUF523 domain-containing protein [Vicinamibacterales bacterium]